MSVTKSETKTERVQLLMSPSEVAAIDDWGFSHRIRTRAEAIRRLCQIGLLVSERGSDIERMLGEFEEALRSIAANAQQVTGAKHIAALERLTPMLEVMSSFITSTNSVYAELGRIRKILDRAVEEIETDQLLAEMESLRGLLSSVDESAKAARKASSS